jgi:hypothetical protein
MGPIIFGGLVINREEVGVVRVRCIDGVKEEQVFV